MKPDPAFWTDILAAESMEPERTFFVDDSPVNVEAARNLGIRAEVFQGADKLRRLFEDLGALEPGARERA